MSGRKAWRSCEPRTRSGLPVASARWKAGVGAGKALEFKTARPQSDALARIASFLRIGVGVGSRPGRQGCGDVDGPRQRSPELSGPAPSDLRSEQQLMALVHIAACPRPARAGPAASDLDDQVRSSTVTPRAAAIARRVEIEPFFRPVSISATVTRLIPARSARADWLNWRRSR